MKTILRNFNPIGGASAASLDSHPGRAESLRKTLELRWSYRLKRVDHPCRHGNAQYVDYSHDTALRERSKNRNAPRIYVLWTGGRCDCDRTVTDNPYLFIDADDLMELGRFHEKGDCGGCTEHCAGFTGRTLAEWLADLGMTIDDLAPARNPLFARASTSRSIRSDFAVLRRVFPGFADHALEHAIARR